MTVLMPAGTRSRNKRDASGGGFVLIEVLVSLTVFAVGIMAVLTAVLSTLDLQKDSALRYRAGLILQDKLAETALVPYNGEAMRGISADGVFSWVVTGEPWAGAPQSENEDPEAENISARIFLVAVDVGWQTTRGTRSVNATQLVQVSSRVEETQ